MSKITKYLNEHLVGEAVAGASTKLSYNSDGSVLSARPELVVVPRTTNDIRKTIRFSWQLAEKGHILGVTSRGFGSDKSGGAIGNGAIIDMQKYLNSVLYVSGKEKNKIIHVQAGASLDTIHEALRWNGLTLGPYTPELGYMTAGGAIAGGLITYRSWRHGTLASLVDRMEVVLANGDLMEVGRVSKRDINKKRGEQTLEGEIYRQLHALFEDESELIERLSSDNDHSGYAIDKVKQKDGSFNLVPLFVGSQGTLGVISEVVLKASFYSGDESAAVIVCKTVEDAQNTADTIKKLAPSSLMMFGKSYLKQARKHGKRFVFDGDDTADDDLPTNILFVSFDDFGVKAQNRKLRRVEKMFAKQPELFYSSDSYRLDEITAVRSAIELMQEPVDSRVSSVNTIDGAYVPEERLREFLASLDELGKKHNLEIIDYVDLSNSVVSANTAVALSTVSGKQKVFRIATDYAKLVYQHGGAMAGSQAEGRLGAITSYPQMTKDVLELNAKIRKIFDPYETLNPGVKQQVETKSLVAMLKS